MKRGQSIIEVLIAVGIAALLLATGGALIRTAITQNTQVSFQQEKTALANGLLQNVQAWAQGNWNTVLGLATTSANLYYLNTSSSPFTAATTTGGESVAIGSTTYTRYFYIDYVYRDASGNATTSVTGTTYDPSTRQVTIIANTPASGNSTTFIMYLTRNGSNVMSQSDWSGGSGQSGPVTVTGNQYYSASNVVTTATGTIQLSPG